MKTTTTMTKAAIMTTLEGLNVPFDPKDKKAVLQGILDNLPVPEFTAWEVDIPVEEFTDWSFLEPAEDEASAPAPKKRLHPACNPFSAEGEAALKDFLKHATRIKRKGVGGIIAKVGRRNVLEVYDCRDEDGCIHIYLEDSLAEVLGPNMPGHNTQCKTWKWLNRWEMSEDQFRDLVNGPAAIL